LGIGDQVPLWRPEDVDRQARCAVGDDAAIAQDDDAPRIATDEFVIVGDKQNGNPLLVELAQEVHETAQVSPVLPHGRLVEDEQFWSQREGGGQSRALLLPAAEGIRTAGAQNLQVGGLQNLVQQCSGNMVEVARAEGHFFLHTIAKELAEGILEQQSHAAARLRRLCGTVPERLPAPGLEQPRQHLGHRGLACSIVTHQSYELAAVDAQIQPLQHGVPTVARLDASQLHQRRRFIVLET